MAEYIERDGIKKTIKAYNWRNPAIPIAVNALIDREPAIDADDVVEVRHGKWKKVSEKYPRYVCTACNHLYNNKEYKYCPYCGAKMDGKGEGE